jgi:hypothetical protein
MIVVTWAMRTLVGMVRKYQILNTKKEESEICCVSL